MIHVYSSVHLDILDICTYIFIRLLSVHSPICPLAIVQLPIPRLSSRPLPISLSFIHPPILYIPVIYPSLILHHSAHPLPLPWRFIHLPSLYPSTNSLANPVPHPLSIPILFSSPNSLSRHQFSDSPSPISGPPPILCRATPSSIDPVFH